MRKGADWRGKKAPPPPQMGETRNLVQDHRGGMREWIGGRRRAGMQDQGFRGNSLEKRKEENIRWIGKEG